MTREDCQSYDLLRALRASVVRSVRRSELLVSQLLKATVSGASLMSRLVQSAAKDWQSYDRLAGALGVAVGRGGPPR